MDLKHLCGPSVLKVFEHGRVCGSVEQLQVPRRRFSLLLLLLLLLLPLLVVVSVLSRSRFAQESVRSGSRALADKGEHESVECRGENQERGHGEVHQRVGQGVEDSGQHAHRGRRNPQVGFVERGDGLAHARGRQGAAAPAVGQAVRSGQAAQRVGGVEQVYHELPPLRVSHRFSAQKAHAETGRAQQRRQTLTPPFFLRFFPFRGGGVGNPSVAFLSLLPHGCERVFRALVQRELRARARALKTRRSFRVEATLCSLGVGLR
mmetsp:Transcript_42365/g.72086  ORF Transcript_42365/g.72086 Transcript_42365/m.72086 type:complete len:263 (+) Transcript_42365:87-875(+)